MSGGITNEDLYALIQEGNKEIKREIGELKNQVNEEIQALKLKNAELEKQNHELKNRISGIERKVKKYNVIAYGVEDEDETVENVMKILNEKLNITCSVHNFRDIYRIGKHIEGKIRPIVLEVLNYNLKRDILEQSKLQNKVLSQMKIYFSHEYTSEDYQKRKFLAEQLKIAKSKQHKATIRNGSLVINGQEFSYEHLKANGLNTILNSTTQPETASTSSISLQNQPQEKGGKKSKYEDSPTTGSKQKIHTRSQVQKNPNFC